MKKRAEVIRPSSFAVGKKNRLDVEMSRGFLSRRVFGCLRHRNLEENDASKTNSGKLVLLLLYLCF